MQGIRLWNPCWWSSSGWRTVTASSSRVSHPTSSSLIATQLFDGNPWSMGTRNWRQPDQWPTKSIMQIRLNIRMNTDAMFRNWKKKENPLETVARLTLSWLRMTQLSFGKPCSIGMRNCKQPDQWPTRSINNIRFTICVNNPIDFNNWKIRDIRNILVFLCWL